MYKFTEIWNKSTSDNVKKEKIISSLRDIWRDTCVREVLFEKTKNKNNFSIITEDEKMKNSAEVYMFISSLLVNPPTHWNSATNFENINLKSENEPITNEDLYQIYEIFY